MKKTFFWLLLPVFFQLQAQNTSLGLSSVFNYYGQVHFYKPQSVIYQPGFDLRLNFSLSKKAKVFSGLEFGWYGGGLKHISNGITYDLHIRTWHLTIPFYRRFMTSEKWHPRMGFILNFPLSTTYTYDIYDGDQRVYHNSNKPVKENFNDFFQIQTGFEYRMGQQWWWDVQINFLSSAQISTGIKYYFREQTKK